jgi:hypothetical protein
MRVYVASSWRNTYQPNVVRLLREDGHEVYDFKGDAGFSWREVDPAWETWSPREYLRGLRHSCAERGFKRDMDALTSCEACVMVMPCGMSASLETGWAMGAGKITCVYVPGLREPDLMVKMAHMVTDNLGMIRRLLRFETVCTHCAEGNSRIQSSVSEAFVHHTSVGRVVCTMPTEAVAQVLGRDPEGSKQERKG